MRSDCWRVSESGRVGAAGQLFDGNYRRRRRRASDCWAGSVSGWVVAKAIRGHEHKPRPPLNAISPGRIDRGSERQEGITAWRSVCVARRRVREDKVSVPGGNGWPKQDRLIPQAATDNNASEREEEDTRRGLGGVDRKKGGGTVIDGGWFVQSLMQNFVVNFHVPGTGQQPALQCWQPAWNSPTRARQSLAGLAGLVGLIVTGWSLILSLAPAAWVETGAPAVSQAGVALILDPCRGGKSKEEGSRSCGVLPVWLSEAVSDRPLRNGQALTALQPRPGRPVPSHLSTSPRFDDW